MSLLPILDTDEIVVHYDPVAKQYRVTLFKDWHFKDEYWFDEYKDTESPTIAYICDGEACNGCKDNGGLGDAGLCCHTTDIRHALDFEEVEPGRFIQKEI